MEIAQRLRLPKTPILARSLLLRLVLGGLALALPGVAAAQSTEAAAPRAPLSEADVIRMAGAYSPAAAVAQATDELAQARSRTAGLLANPALSWARETVDTGPTAGQGSQDLFTASIPIDIARPLAIRSLVASEGAWMRAEASLSRTDGVLAALLAYYDVVLAERRVEVLSQAVSNLEEAARVLARREAAGTASGYESTRHAIAGELTRSHLAEARGALTAAKARLGGLLGVPPESLRVATALDLISPSDEAALARGRGASRQAVQRARESLQLAGEAEDRAAWAWRPALELGGGVKRANNFGDDDGYGYVLGLSFSVPLFDHGQAQREQAEAQRALATARSEALTRTIDADVQSALATFRTARAELTRFESQISGQIEALLTAAQSGYREGERTIVELLDAQRAQTDVAERRLSLLGTAKHAEARLRAAAGDLQ
jgi:outer membrane protein, heavy metal efflux system